MKPNDWVQAVRQLVEEDGTVASEPGGVGHVLHGGTEDDEDVLNVFFERTGVITIVHRDDLRLLGGPETGKTEFPKKPKTETPVSVIYSLNDMLLTKKASLAAMERHKPKYWESAAASTRRDIAALETAMQYIHY